MKKRFHLLKRLVYKNGKAQKMPLVACRLVWYMNGKGNQATKSKSAQGDLEFRRPISTVVRNGQVNGK